MRFCVDTATWLPDWVKDRLRQIRPQNFNAKGDFIVSSQLTRTQEQNYRDAFEKLQGFIDEACIPEKEREFKEYKESEDQKAHRIESKRKDSHLRSLRATRGSKERFDF